MDTGADVVLDGSMYEGGGGLLRDSLSYSTILNKSMQVHSIRAKRPGKGGLRAEHTVAISSMASLSAASTRGLQDASQWIGFWPYTSHNCENSLTDKLGVDLEGSAAIALVSLLPYVLFSRLCSGEGRVGAVSPDGISLDIKGGTLCIKAPSYEYTAQVMVPTLYSIGLSNHFTLSPSHEQGWHTDFVKTRTGLLKAWARPMTVPLPAFVLSHRGRIANVRATAHAPATDIDLFRRILKTNLGHFLGKSMSATNPQSYIDISMFESNVASQYHLLLTARTEEPAAHLGHELVYPQAEGFPLDGDIDTRLEFLTRACIKGFLAELRHGNAVDEHMENILTVYQALAVGWSSVTSPTNEQAVKDLGYSDFGEDPHDRYTVSRSSLHLETSRWVAEQVAGVHFDEKDGRFGCVGLGIGQKCPE